MSDSKDSSGLLLRDLIAYRDKMAAVDPSTYQGAYVDGLNMAIFLVQAAMHRDQLTDVLGVDWDAVLKTAGHQ